VQELPLLGKAEVLDHVAISLIELLKTAGKLAKGQVAGKHRAAWAEDFDGFKYPWADLSDCPIYPEDTLHPEDLHGYVRASTHDC
jgi:hypothetical protein